MNKTAFVISIVLTTFVLMAVGGIAYAINLPQTPQAQAEDEAYIDETALEDPAAAEAAAVDAAAVESADPAPQQALAEREAAYQQLISEANTRLAQAQQQQVELQAQVNALQSGVTAAAEPQAGLTLEQAAQIAADFLGQTSVYSVELVNISGQDMYKVDFYSGDIVYVGLDGQIVGSVSGSFSLGAWDPPAASDNAPVFTGSGNGGGGGGGGGEHEAHEQEEHEEHDDD